MSAARKNTLSQVMKTAWSLFRKHGGTFAMALRWAWNIIKSDGSDFMINIYTAGHKVAASSGTWTSASSTSRGVHNGVGRGYGVGA